MLIESINLQRLENAEFLQFGKNFLNIIQLNDAMQLQVEPQYTAYGNSIAYIDKLFKTERASASTALLENLDIRRDEAINGIAAVVNGFSYHFDPIISAAADKIQLNLKNYGTGIARENYQKETALINSILGDWATKPALTDAISVLKLTDWVAELTGANEAFNALYVNRTQELGAVNPDSIMGQRLEATRLYYNLRDTLNAWFTIKLGAAPYDKVTNECNALIQQYNALTTTSTPDEPAADTPVEPAPVG